MKDVMFLIYFLWLAYGLTLLGRSEVFLPLLWVMAVLSVFMALLGMFAESAHSAQTFRMAELEHKQTMERKSFDHQAELNYRSQSAKINADNASYFLHGLGADKK